MQRASEASLLLLSLFLVSPIKRRGLSWCLCRCVVVRHVLPAIDEKEKKTSQPLSFISGSPPFAERQSPCIFSLICFRCFTRLFFFLARLFLCFVCGFGRCRHLATFFFVCIFVVCSMRWTRQPSFTPSREPISTYYYGRRTQRKKSVGLSLVRELPRGFRLSESTEGFSKKSKKVHR